MNKKLTELGLKMKLHTMPRWAIYALAAIFLLSLYCIYLEISHMRQAGEIYSSCASCGG